MENQEQTQDAAHTAAPSPAVEYRSVPLARLQEHPLNPRKNFDPKKLEELAASIREKGILNPLIVRAGSAYYQILAGARRYRAAKLAGLTEVPVVAYSHGLSDVAALELLVVDNQQRTDVHPLEEAEGYRQLMAHAKYDAARIAQRIGLNVHYVYDRLKLLSLTKAAQKAFLAGEFTIGHAVILARLKPADQERAMTEHDALFTDERPLFTPDEEDELGDAEPRKPRSVRELQGWVDAHVKLEAPEADPMLFPETVATVTEAVAEKEKVVRITHEVMTPEEAKGGPPVILGRSWKRADGQRGSKQCDRSVIGMIVIGPGRGEALRVCTDKKRCTVHWGELIKAAKKREAAVTKSASTGEDREAARRKRELADEARRKVAEARWEKAEPAIFAAMASAMKRAPAGAGGALGKLLLRQVVDSLYLPKDIAPAKFLSAGKTAEDLVRHLGLAILLQEYEDNARDEPGRKELGDALKVFGVDVNKIVDQVAPLKAEPQKTPAAKRRQPQPSA